MNLEYQAITIKVGSEYTIKDIINDEQTIYVFFQSDTDSYRYHHFII